MKQKSIAGPFYKMKSEGPKGEILLYSDIGTGGFFDSGTSAESFARDLRALGKVSAIDLRVNSAGGNVFEGIAIYNLLAAHPARIVTYIDGLAASIASVVCMAGDEINIADNGMMMIHNAWGMGIGSADDLRKTADVLDSITATIADTYVKRTGGDLKAIRAMMDQETWMSAKEACDAGFADTVIDSMKLAACAFDPTRFKNAPRALIEKISEMPNRDRFAARFQALQADKIRARLAVR